MAFPQAQGDANPLVTESRLVGKQFIFRVRDPRAQTSRKPRQSKSLTQGGQEETPACHSRKPHRKSRTGCGNCKRRRVKCDETKPGCQKCNAYGIRCDYYNTVVPCPRRSPHGTPSLDATILDLSVADLAARVNDALSMGSGAAPALSSDSKVIKALRQFAYFASKNGYMPDSHRKVLVGGVMRLAFGTPYLMHAMLGCSASAVSRVCDDDGSFKALEAYHWHHAIRGYQKALTAPIGRHNMDELMSTCLLMSMLSFSEPYYDPRKSWIFSTNPRDLNWLLVQGGLKYLLQFTWRWLDESIWTEVFAESSSGQVFDRYPSGVEYLHPDLRELCGIDETSTEENNPFYWTLRMLTPLLDIKVDRSTFNLLCGFIGRLEAPFTDYLLRKDVRALLIFAYWLGKMCEDPSSWAYPRFYSECVAICMYLENHQDPQVLRLLEYPAAKCGYLLRHVREQAVFADSLDTMNLSHVPTLIEYPAAFAEKCVPEYGDLLDQHANEIWEIA
ncbi:hypothetical protein VTO42DRAFT_4970 [Malbranchea cinnamomea]